MRTSSSGEPSCSTRCRAPRTTRPTSPSPSARGTTRAGVAGPAARGGGDPGGGAPGGDASRPPLRSRAARGADRRRAHGARTGRNRGVARAGAVEQIVIDEELRAAGVRVPPLGITGWNIMTVNQYATEDQVERWVRQTLLGEYIWCQLFSEPDAGSDAAAVTTRGTRVDGGWRVNGQKVWTSGAQYCHLGLATVRTDPRSPEACRHHDDGDRHARTRCRGAAAAPDHGQRGLQRGLLRRRVRARRRRGRHRERRVDRRPLDPRQRACVDRRQFRRPLPLHGSAGPARAGRRPRPRRLGPRRSGADARSTSSSC